MTYSKLSDSDNVDVEPFPVLQIRQQLLQIRPRDAAEDAGVVDDVRLLRRAVVEDVELRRGGCQHRQGEVEGQGNGERRQTMLNIGNPTGGFFQRLDFGRLFGEIAADWLEGAG